MSTIERAHRGEDGSEAEWVEFNRVRPWAQNPRQNEAAVEKVADSIMRFGWGAPILARRENGEIVAGHTRYAAAMKLGMEKVLVRWLDITEKDAHLFAVADNKLGELADWDDGALAAILQELRADDLDLSVTGFSDRELEAILADVQDPFADDAEGADEAEIKDEGKQKIGFRVLMVDVARAKEVVAKALADAGIEAELC